MIVFTPSVMLLHEYGICIFREKCSDRIHLPEDKTVREDCTLSGRTSGFRTGRGFGAEGVHRLEERPVGAQDLAIDGVDEVEDFQQTL